MCSPGFGGDGCERVVVPPVCPYKCSGHGRCMSSGCQCEAGWSGLACNVYDLRMQACKANCSGHGACVNATCLCDDGYSGEDCSQLRHLAGCREGCSGHGECRRALLFAGPLPGVRRRPPPSEGLCACAAGYGGPSCAKGVATEPACPMACSGHGLCREGGCACEAGFGGNDCGVVCPGRCSRHGTCTDDGTCACARGWTGASCEIPTACPKGCSGHGACRTATDADEVAEEARFAAETHRLAAIAADTASTAIEEAQTIAKAAADMAALAAARAVQAAMPRCECARGWMSVDCSVRDDHCPVSCGQHGRCSKGQCVCEAGWRGPYCATDDALTREAAMQSLQSWRVHMAHCPGNCTGLGAVACLAGTCYCADGFQGPDCTSRIEKAGY